VVSKTPLPHLIQSSGIPGIQVYPGSIWQVEVHPSPSPVPPSSQPSVPFLIESPQNEHKLGDPEQIYPPSIVQMAEHPSPPRGGAPMSLSQASMKALIPSPQVAKHVSGIPGG